MERPYGYEEVDLYEYWLTLRRRWPTIGLVFVLALLAAAAASVLMPRVYRVTAAISPGRLGVSSTGQVIRVVPPEDLVALIQGGAFNRAVIRALGLDERRYARKLRFKAKVQRGGEAVIVTYDTEEPDLGVRAVGELIEQIKRAYNIRARNKRRAIEAQIHSTEQAIRELQVKRAKLASDVKIKEQERKKVEATIRRLKERRKVLEAARKRLVDMLGLLERNTRDLLTGKLKLAEHPDQQQLLAYVLFSNNLQQNIAFISNAYERLKGYEVSLSKIAEQVDKLRLSIKELEEGIKKLQLERDEAIPARVDKLRNEIERLRAQRDQVEEIRALSPPGYLRRPVRPRLGLNLALAGTLGLFTGVVLAFFLEWLERNRQRAG